jgi:CheY-like chemotaxis protein
MRRRVLLIDDDPHMVDLVSGSIKAEDYEVRWAKNGVEGLQAADAAPPDVVLLDVEMPGMGGYEVCRILRHGDKTRHIPVVMLTSSTDPELSRMAYLAGAQACVPKPFRREGLLAAISAAIACMPKERPK